MDIPSYIALSRITAQQRDLDVTAANLANALTPGYKSARLQFSDWLLHEPGAKAAPGSKTIAFTQDRAEWRDLRDGSLSHTGNPLDLAIAGDAYFTVSSQQGPKLTRAGRFGLTPSGTIVDSNGNALLDVSGRPVQVSPADTKIDIAADGTISSENGQIGKIGLVRPADPNQLHTEGGDLLRTDSPTTPATNPKLLQGAVEESNVQPVIETTRMVSQLREFQLTAQFLQGEADRQQGAIDKILTRRG